MVHLDLRHLGQKKLLERLPFICESGAKLRGCRSGQRTDPGTSDRALHHGRYRTDKHCETRIKALFAVGECSSVGLHGANRLGSNSLAEPVVFGRMAGEQAAERAATAGAANVPSGCTGCWR
ncbi:FAD-binding protein [Shigella flexneri]